MELCAQNDTMVYSIHLKSQLKKMMHTAKNMHQILDLALPAYDELFDEIELDGLVENKGILYIGMIKDLKSQRT